MPLNRRARATATKHEKSLEVDRSLKSHLERVRFTVVWLPSVGPGLHRPRARNLHKKHELVVKERQELSHQNPCDIVRWIEPQECICAGGSAMSVPTGIVSEQVASCSQWFTGFRNK